MDDDLDLRGFTGEARLFPLPRVVLFPHVVLPLHIFEPRYRQMTEDALASDKLITIVQIRPRSLAGGWTEPAPLEDVGCLGRIIQHERLADGRFNMLLLGRKRVRIQRETPCDRLYRTAEVDILEDVAPSSSEESKRADLIELFRDVIESKQAMDLDLSALLAASTPLGVLTDLIAHAISFSPELKQRLLDEPSVDSRFTTIRDLLRLIVDENPPSRPFPPDFSVN